MAHHIVLCAWGVREAIHIRTYELNAHAGHHARQIVHDFARAGAQAETEDAFTTLAHSIRLLAQLRGVSVESACCVSALHRT